MPASFSLFPEAALRSYVWFALFRTVGQGVDCCLSKPSSVHCLQHVGTGNRRGRTSARWALTPTPALTKEREREREREKKKKCCTLAGMFESCLDRQVRVRVRGEGSDQPQAPSLVERKRCCFAQHGPLSNNALSLQWGRQQSVQVVPMVFYCCTWRCEFFKQDRGGTRLGPFSGKLDP